MPLPKPTPLLGVYDLKMRLRAGRGPGAADPVTRSAAKGVVADGQIGSDLVVAVPVTSAENVVGVARASVAGRVVWARVILAWLVLVALAGGSLPSRSLLRAVRLACSVSPWRHCLRRPNASR